MFYDVGSFIDKQTGNIYTIGVDFGDIDAPETVQLFRLGRPHGEPFPFDHAVDAKIDPIQKAANYIVLANVYTDAVKSANDFQPILLCVDD